MNGAKPAGGKIPRVAEEHFHPSVRSVVLGPFAIFVFLLISRVGVQRRDAFILQWIL